MPGATDHLLTADDRADDNSEHFTCEWSDEEIGNVLAKADELDRRPTQRQEYSPVVRSAIETGQRLGELLGSDWGTDGLDLEAGVWNVTKAWTKAGKLGAVKTRTAFAASRSLLTSSGT